MFFTDKRFLSNCFFSIVCLSSLLFSKVSFGVAMNEEEVEAFINEVRIQVLEFLDDEGFFSECSLALWFRK